jgi:hypothetical protein
MKKILVAFGLLLALSMFFQAPLSLAESDYGSFDVSEILDIDESDNNTGQSTDIYENIKNDADEKQTSVVSAVILRAINVLTLLIGTFTFVTLLISGYLMITAGGDTGKIDKAKGMISPAILGMILAFFSYFIAAFIQSFFY